MTKVIHVETDQVPKYLNCGGEGDIVDGGGVVFDSQESQGFLHLGKWCHVLRGGNNVLETPK